MKSIVVVPLFLLLNVACTAQTKKRVPAQPAANDSLKMEMPVIKPKNFDSSMPTVKPDTTKVKEMPVVPPQPGVQPK